MKFKRIPTREELKAAEEANAILDFLENGVQEAGCAPFGETEIDVGVFSWAWVKRKGGTNARILLNGQIIRSFPIEERTKIVNEIVRTFPELDLENKTKGA